VTKTGSIWHSIIAIHIAFLFFLYKVDKKNGKSLYVFEFATRNLILIALLTEVIYQVTTISVGLNDQ